MGDAAMPTRNHWFLFVFGLVFAALLATPALAGGLGPCGTGGGHPIPEPAALTLLGLGVGGLLAIRRKKGGKK